MINEEDPHDDATHWAGQLPKADRDSAKHIDKRDTGRASTPIVQRKELPKK